jgi:hypothetical protein
MSKVLESLVNESVLFSEDLHTLEEVENQIRNLAYKKWEEAGCPTTDGGLLHAYR